jgi:hypothetical protein
MGISKTPKRIIIRFHERTGEDWTLLGGYLEFFENHGYV